MKTGLDRERLLTGAVGEDREVLARALDLAELAMRYRQFQRTDFLNPYQVQLILAVMARLADVRAIGDGGYPEAERQQIVVYPDYLQWEDGSEGLAFLQLSGQFGQTRQPNHRDYLGALLGLGLKRSKLGDILVDEQGAQLIVAQEVAGFIQANLLQVSRWSVEIQETTRQALRLPEKKGKEVCCTVASLRLDAVAAAGYGISRSKLVGEINGENAMLNWKPCKDPGRNVQEGDVISFKGRGRMEIVSVNGTSRKGRIFVTLRRLL